MNPETIIIRSVQQDEKQTLAELIRRSYRDVAKRFELTVENCPKHPSNCTESWIAKDLERGVRYFFATHQNTAIGCAGLEIATGEIAYLERLAVLPANRRKGVGEKLARHVLDLASARGAQNISVGIIAAQEELKNWYQRMGFKEGDTKSFDHLPFMVTFMSYDLK